MKRVTFSPVWVMRVIAFLAHEATFTFKTPATIGSGGTAAFKIGLFNTNGNSGLAADLSASSTTPNPIYDPLPGYVMDFDVNPASGANITFREKSPVPGSTGQLLGTTTGLFSSALAETPTASRRVRITSGPIQLPKLRSASICRVH